MGCSGCSTDSNGAPKGCGSNGHCSTGRCNKLNTYDWLSPLELHDPTEFEYVEVSFKNGARKDFFKHQERTGAITGDLVVVESANGYDVGRISLSGELVRLQMKKKRAHEDRVLHKILRIAHERDIERLDEARDREKAALVRARAIARMLDIQMKVGDVEFQGDNRKATFYYTADGRIDFRELVRHYASEFKVKIEMRQIGSRQESARIGGLGPCGRELCCSTWLSDFKSVSTSAARYQNLAINQTKLSGQCGRLKCCLNYELDSYLDAIKTFPKRAERIKTTYHSYELIKTDIFKGIMYYIQLLDKGRGPILAIPKGRVAEVLELNRKGEYPEEIGSSDYATIGLDKEEEIGYEDVTGGIELPPERKKRRSKDRRGSNDNRNRDKRDDRSPKNEGDKRSGRGPRPEGEKRENRPDRKSRPKNNRHTNRSDKNGPQNQDEPSTKKEDSPSSRDNTRSAKPKRNRPPRNKKRNDNNNDNNKPKE